MKEIDHIIELATNTQSERLSLATRYLVQVNFTFTLTVHSQNFKGSSHFCVRRDEIEKLCEELTSIHMTLSGSTRLNDNDSDGFIGFLMEKEGHLIVSGQVGGSHEDHFLKFKFQTDQTCIPKFVHDLRTLLKN